MIDCVFISKLENYKEENPSSELVYYINKGLDLEILYDALRSLYMVVYCAPLFKKKGRIFASYQFRDIDNTIEPIRTLSDELIRLGEERGSAPQKAIEICKGHYLLSASDYEIKKMHEFVKDEDEFQYGYIGTHLKFNEFASDAWDNIKNDILMKIEH